MNFMAVVGILMLYTYARAIAAPSPLRYEKPDSNVTSTLALTSTANALPPDPDITELPLVGRVRCYSYGYSPWESDLKRALIHANTVIYVLVMSGQGNQRVYNSQRYSRGHASLNLDPSPQLTWFQLAPVLGFLSLNSQEYTPGTFLLEVRDGPSGVWNGSLTTD